MFDFLSQILEFLAPFVVLRGLLVLLMVAIIGSFVAVLLGYYLVRFAGFAISWQPQDLVGAPRDHRLSAASATDGITAHAGQEPPSHGDDRHARLSHPGVGRSRRGKLPPAGEALRTAMAVVPHDAFSHCTLGIVYYSQGRYDDAIKSLKRAIEINPGNATAHHYLGLTYARKGRPAEAAQELEKARELDPTHENGLGNDARLPWIKSQAPAG